MEWLRKAADLHTTIHSDTTAGLSLLIAQYQRKGWTLIDTYEIDKGHFTPEGFVGKYSALLKKPEDVIPENMQVVESETNANKGSGAGADTAGEHGLSPTGTTPYIMPGTGQK